ncbi:MAG: undecaprenyl/decaprenyl-phosphate alpha-N-acetylglucosaminyl 1-phosphate transferase [Planctomycetota bacterium]|nr:undecaprenyl/decaprenyl-phosphate alpha-N-acetylglucosaminyl 1-phosphate transferase [Planctomycetota bacterium]
MGLFDGEPLTAWSAASLGVGASIVVGLAAYLLRRPARRAGLLSRPRPDRFGDGRIPLVGGIALLLGIAVVSLALRIPPPRVHLIAGLGFFLIGLCDDATELRPGLKLVLQIVVAAWAAYLVAPTWTYAGLLLFSTLFLVNSCNYLDNMDGLLSGVAVMQALALALVSVVWGAATGGGTLLLWTLPAVLLFSAPPARIYLGDAGSHLIGGLFAADVAVILIGPNGLRTHALVPLAILFAVQIADFATVSISRQRAGRPLWEGGTDHLSHRLVRHGFAVPQAVLVLVLASAVCGFASLLLAHLF